MLILYSKPIDLTFEADGGIMSPVRMSLNVHTTEESKMTDPSIGEVIAYVFMGVFLTLLASPLGVGGMILAALSMPGCAAFSHMIPSSVV